MQWYPIDTAPSLLDYDKEILVFGGRYKTPSVVKPDGDWWRYQKKNGNVPVPTHWAFIHKPVENASLTMNVRVYMEELKIIVHVLDHDIMVQGNDLSEAFMRLALTFLAEKEMHKEKGENFLNEWYV